MLAKELDRVNRLFIPKGENDAEKNMEIISLRTEYLLKGKVFSSENTDWTVIYTEEKGLANPCFSRVVFVKPIQELKDLNNRGIQTIGIHFNDLENKKSFIDRNTLYGGDRCPPLGTMTLFDSPWDGMFAMDRMIRWVVTWK